MGKAQTFPPSTPASSNNPAPAPLPQDTSRQEFAAASVPDTRRADRLPYWPSASRLESPPGSPYQPDLLASDRQSRSQSPPSLRRRATIGPLALSTLLK